VHAASGLYSSRDPRILVGLGDVERVDSVVIRWPNGNMQVEEHVPLDRYYVVRERVEETR
jgi:hypothetical protein